MFHLNNPTRLCHRSKIVEMVEMVEMGVMVLRGGKNFPKLSDRPEVRENLAARNEGKNEVEEPGVDTAADQLHYEGVLDGGQDPLLILHVLDLPVPDDVLEGHDLQCVVLLSLFMLTEENSRKLSCNKVKPNVVP